ncbi:MAG: short-chain fatty acid transporter [Bradymonadales bacterium]|nr:short-chain fatty acid transporter [Bradymonadales bacterium]
MIARIGLVLSRISQRVVPDPFVLALFLTVLVLLAGGLNLWLGDAGTEDGVVATLWKGWLGGFSSLDGLSFALQMCLILVTGHALASSPPIQRFVKGIAVLPRTTAHAACLVAIVACVAGVIHWGLGAIVGALLAREIARAAAARGIRFHYPLLGGAAYTGLAVWHGGFSASAPLKVAEEGHFLADLVGTISTRLTIFSPLNLLITGTLLVVIPLFFAAMAPRREAELVPADPEKLGRLPTSEDTGGSGFLNKLQGSRWVGASIGLIGVGTLVVAAFRWDLGFDLNTVNVAFLWLGLVFHGRVRNYLVAITDGARGAGGIILQFPFYFAILGVMRSSGLITLISQAMSHGATTQTFPVLAFLSAGFVNLFVPSGGGQWAVQGEILLHTGSLLQVDPSTTVMAFAYGDAWTNMLQPFWALPLLGIMGLKARDIVGYTAVVFFAMLVLVPVLLLIMA